MPLNFYIFHPCSDCGLRELIPCKASWLSFCSFIILKNYDDHSGRLCIFGCRVELYFGGVVRISVSQACWLISCLEVGGEYLWLGSLVACCFSKVGGKKRKHRAVCDHNTNTGLRSDWCQLECKCVCLTLSSNCVSVQMASSQSFTFFLQDHYKLLHF